MTPKQIAKAIKAKGLQKLRWYCQMCQKQCRDENGFKQHCTSDSHQRMMKVFSENPESFLDDFSKQFETGFMDLVRRRWRTTRIAANKVYNEYIQDRHHTHMNGTKWTTLGEFVKHLGKTAQCEVEETEKGWFIKYIDRDPDMLKLQESIKKKEKMDASDEMRNQRRIEAQMAALQQLKAENASSAEEHEEENGDAAANAATGAHGSVAPPPVRNPEEKIKISLSLGPKKQAPVEPTQKEAETDSSADRKRKRDLDDYAATSTDTHSRLEDTKASIVSSSSALPDAKRQKLSAIEEIRLAQEAKKERENRKDYWLYEGIIVKVLNKKVGDGAFYKKKALVTRVEDTYLGVVKILDTGHKIKIDQAELETVIPNRGGHVLIVNGAYRGEQAVLVDVLVEQFKAIVRVESGPYRGNTCEKNYEDICKLATVEEQQQ